MKLFLIINLIIALTSADTTVAPTTASTKEPIGGKKDADVNDKTVQEMVAFAFEVIGIESNSPHAYKMGKVLKAQTQVVNGIDYYLTFEMSETDCVKVTTDLTNCSVIETDRCDAVVLSRPWDTPHQKRILSYECNEVTDPFEIPL